MKKLMSTAWVAIVFSLWIAGVLSSCSTDSGYPTGVVRPGPVDARFLEVYGAVNYAPNTPGASNHLSLALVTKDADGFAEGHIEAAFDHPLVMVEEASIEKNLTYGGYTLWQLNCTVSVPLDEVSEEDLTVHQVKIGDTAYGLGTLTFRITEEACSYDAPLCLLAHAAAADGLNLSSYTATFQNRAPDEVIITSVALPGFEQAGSYLVVGDMEPDADIPATAALENEVMYQLSQEAAPVKPDQLSELIVDLKDCTIDPVQVYYVSPVIHYQYQGESFQVPLYYFVAGLAMTNDEFLEMAKALSW